MAVSCATHPPRWTPETVQAPAGVSEHIADVVPLDQRVEPIDAATPEGSTGDIPLTRDGAVLTALLRNRSIEVARFGPAIGETYIPEARAEFDPVLLAAVSTGRDTHQQPLSLSTNMSTFHPSDTPGGSPALDTAIDVFALAEQWAVMSRASILPVTRTDSTTGSVTLQEKLPTGTVVSLSGGDTASETTSLRDDYYGNWSLQVQQPLLRGAPLAVNLVALRQARNQAAQSEYAFRATVLDTVHQVELAYWALVLAKETLQIRQFAVELAAQQLKTQQDLFAVGRAIEGDVMAAQAEKASRVADLADATAASRQQTIALVQLLNPEHDRKWDLHFDPIDTPDTSAVRIDPNTSEQLALTHRPELTQAKLAVANLDLDAQRAKNGLLPQLDVVASYGQTSRGTEKSDAARYLDSSRFENYRVGVEVQVPILNRAEKARYHRANLARGQGESSLGNLESVVASEVRQAVVGVEKQTDRIRATQEALTNRVEQLRVAQDRNAVGKTTNLDVLLVQRDLIQARVDEAAARVQYAQALTDLYAAEGTLLQRRGISLDTVRGPGDAPLDQVCLPRE